MPTTKIIKEVKTNIGETLSQISADKTVLLVFLRHFGCIFCKEAMLEIGKKRDTWKGQDVEVVLVHMSDEALAESYFKTYHLEGVTHISDPSTNVYTGFGLTKGSGSQLFGFKNWIRGFDVVVSKGITPSIKPIGDGFQMPGVFIIKNSMIVESFIHKTAADKPDYEALVSCCTN